MDSKLPALIYRPSKAGMIPRAVFLDGSERPEAPMDPESHAESQEAPRVLRARKAAVSPALLSAPESDDEGVKPPKKKKPSKTAKKPPPVVKAAGASKAGKSCSHIYISVLFEINFCFSWHQEGEKTGFRRRASRRSPETESLDAATFDATVFDATAFNAFTFLSDLSNFNVVWLIIVDQ